LTCAGTPPHVMAVVHWPQPIQASKKVVL
jgi:hypothetical protein